MPVSHMRVDPDLGIIERIGASHVGQHQQSADDFQYGCVSAPESTGGNSLMISPIVASRICTLRARWPSVRLSQLASDNAWLNGA